MAKIANYINYCVVVSHISKIKVEQTDIEHIRQARVNTVDNSRQNMIRAIPILLFSFVLYIILSYTK